MKTEKEITDLADKKIAAAECLLANGLYDDAYYIGGYAFELLLKAKICKTLCIPDFFEFDAAKASLKVKPEAQKPFKVHNYEQLIVLSGLYSEFSTAINDLSFKADWSVISSWDESFRYKSGSTQSDAASFLASLKNMIVWLKKQI